MRQEHQRHQSHPHRRQHTNRYPDVLSDQSRRNLDHHDIPYRLYTPHNRHIRITKTISVHIHIPFLFRKVIWIRIITVGIVLYKTNGGITRFLLNYTEIQKPSPSSSAKYARGTRCGFFVRVRTRQQLQLGQTSFLSLLLLLLFHPYIHSNNA